ncbi:transposase [Methyloglobulus sp.]|uniref:transposase n=1 Tax=Methyloglobulus sp. TaxID=2518622 RepID=UPI0032B72A71
MLFDLASRISLSGMTGIHPHRLRGYFADLDREIDNWHKAVFNYFDHRVTNAYNESANNHIKPDARQGRGYSFEVLRTKVLFTIAKHKLKKKSFKSGIRENILGHGLPNSDESNKCTEPFKQEFLNFGVIIPHGAEK